MQKLMGLDPASVQKRAEASLERERKEAEAALERERKEADAALDEERKKTEAAFDQKLIEEGPTLIDVDMVKRLIELAVAADKAMGISMAEELADDPDQKGRTKGSSGETRLTELLVQWPREHWLQLRAIANYRHDDDDPAAAWEKAVRNTREFWPADTDQPRFAGWQMGSARDDALALRGNVDALKKMGKWPGASDGSE